MAKNTTGKSASAISKPAAQLSLVAGVTFLVLFAALHFLKPDLDPSWRAISEYALGDYGWVMTIAFLLWSLSAFSLFFAIRSQAQTIPAKIGLGFLLLGAVGPLLAGIFPTDPVTTPLDQVTTTGSIHAIGATLTDAFPIAGTFLIVSFLRKNVAWRNAKWPLILALVLAWVSFWLVSIALMVLMPQHGNKLGPEVTVGWYNRLMIVGYVGLVATTAWAALKVRSKKSLGYTLK